MFGACNSLTAFFLTPKFQMSPMPLRIFWYAFFSSITYNFFQCWFRNLLIHPSHMSCFTLYSYQYKSYKVRMCSLSSVYLPPFSLQILVSPICLVFSSLCLNPSFTCICCRWPYIRFIYMYTTIKQSKLNFLVILRIPLKYRPQEETETIYTSKLLPDC